MSSFEVLGAERVPIKAWIKGVPIEDAAAQQLRNVARLPFVYKHVAAMPDVHCGMAAAMTSLVANDLPDSLAAMRSAIEAAVPHGRTDNGGKNDRGAWGKGG